MMYWIKLFCGSIHVALLFMVIAKNGVHISVGNDNFQCEGSIFANNLYSTSGTFFRFNRNFALNLEYEL